MTTNYENYTVSKMENAAPEESTFVYEKKAVMAAMKGAWDQAIKFNQKILKIEPQNTHALNRLAWAFFKKNEITSAQKTYRRVLLIDSYNPIAQKNLNRLNNLHKGLSKKETKEIKTKGTIFIEEAGKTKTVKLVRLASPSVLSQLDSADEVIINPKKHTINITNNAGVYLGAVPDDLSHRLLHLIKGGNQYQSFVKTVDRQNLEIFIRETKRAPQFRNQPSFALHHPLVRGLLFR